MTPCVATGKLLRSTSINLSPCGPRLSHDAYHFFREADVHDGELLELSMADGSRSTPLNQAAASPWTLSSDYPVKAKLSVVDSSEKLVWHISYNRVRRSLIDYPTENPLFYMSPQEGFGDWGNHELTDAGSGLLRHEVLFSTGAVLLFEFLGIDISCVERSPRPA